MKLAQWLCQQQVKFVLRIKQERYIQSDEEDYTRLSELGLLPGTNFYLRGVKVTKQKGFGSFNVAAYWKRKYRGKAETQGWYLLTNLEDLQQSIKAFKCRSGIEAMFKDCKTGGYNLEKTQASKHRFNSLILLIALAYSCAILQGQQMKRKGIQNYVGRLKEERRSRSPSQQFLDGIIRPILGNRNRVFSRNCQ